jgi:hypothetical protein
VTVEHLDLFQDSPQRGDGSGDQATDEVPFLSPGRQQTPRVYQLTELPGESFEEIFVCQIDESAGLADDDWDDAA